MYRGLLERNGTGGGMGVQDWLTLKNDHLVWLVTPLEELRPLPGWTAEVAVVSRRVWTPNIWDGAERR